MGGMGWSASLAQWESGLQAAGSRSVRGAVSGNWPFKEHWPGAQC